MKPGQRGCWEVISSWLLLAIGAEGQSWEDPRKSLEKQPLSLFHPAAACSAKYWVGPVLPVFTTGKPKLQAAEALAPARKWPAWKGNHA